MSVVLIRGDGEGVRDRGGDRESTSSGSVEVEA